MLYVESSLRPIVFNLIPPDSKAKQSGEKQKLKT